MARQTITHEDAADRFWAKVNKDGPIPAACPELGPCWLWTAGLFQGSGYGQFWFNYHQMRAHRFCFLLVYGAIPNNLLVLHRCDTPACVNPGHLFLGTSQDNTRDMINKGRGVNMACIRTLRITLPQGERNGAAKLTEQAVRAIRAKHANGELGVTLAREFDVSRALICNIVRRKIWTHI